jgi:hypothetical protein
MNDVGVNYERAFKLMRGYMTAVMNGGPNCTDAQIFLNRMADLEEEAKRDGWLYVLDKAQDDAAS